MTRFTWNRQLHLRRAAFALLVVVAALAQHTRGGLLAIGAAHAYVLVPLCVAISMRERSVVAMLFGVFAGVLWDYAAPTGDGFYAVALCVLCFACGALCSFVLRANLRACLLLNAAGLLLLCAAHWFFFLFLPGHDRTGALFLQHEVPSILYTFVWAPVCYWVVTALTRSFEERV